MSIDRHTYVGPYLVTPKPPLVPTQEVFTGCPKCKTPMYNSEQRYCSVCGSQKQKVTHTVMRRSADREEQTRQNVFIIVTYMADHSQDEYDLWVLNKRWQKRNLLVHDEDSQFWVTPEFVAMELQAFQKDFEHEIAAISRYCGEIQVRWGVLTWTN